MRVYLCGPMTGCTFAEASEWRDEAKFWLRRHGIVALDPMDRDYRDSPLSHLPALVEEDKIDVALADILLVNFDSPKGPSVGTSMEILLAWQMGKRVIIVSEDYTENPWLVYHSHNIYRTMEEAYDKIFQIFKEKNRT